MINIDSSLFIQIVNFVFLICVLNVVLYKPIRKVILQRKEKISGLEKSIKTSERDMGEKDEALSAGIKSAREMGLKKRESILNSAAEEERKIAESIHRKAQQEILSVREQIARDAERVRNTLQKEIDEFAGAIGQKILGRGLQ